MLAVAWPAVAAAWILQQFDSQPLLSVPAPLWLLLAMAAWCLLGGRVALVVLVSGWTLCRADWLFETRPAGALVGRDVVIQGLVCDFPRTDREALRLVLHTEGSGGAPLPERVHLSWYDDSPQVRPGERWQLRIRVRAPRGLANDGAFDFEHWLYVRSIAATGYVRPSRLNRRLPSGPADCPVGRARSALAARIERALGDHPGGAYVLGVAVGATQQLSDEDWELLRRTGTTHLLAISGLNIAMVAAPFLIAGPLLGRVWAGLAGRPHAGLIPALLAAAVYSALAGFAISTVRALAMLCAAALISRQRRRVDVLDLLSGAALVILAIDPAGVTSPGFWLSFLAVGWLLLAATPPQRVADHAPGRARWRRRMLQEGRALGRAQLVLGLGLAPVTVALFGQVSLVAPLTNILAVPVFSLAVMPFTLAGSGLLAVAPATGAMLLTVAADVGQALIGFLRWVDETGPIAWEAPAPDAATLVSAAAAGLVLCWWRPLPLRSLGAVLLLPAVAGTTSATTELRVDVLDVGQGLAVLVRTARHAMLYDAGPAFRLRDAGESVVLPVLRRAGVRHLDAVVISHDDRDHSGGARTVLRKFPRTRLIASREAALAAGEFVRCEAGLSWQWDGVHFRVLSPGQGEERLSDNDASCVLRVASRRSVILLPGDIGQGREDLLAASGRLGRTDLVVAPHHGSRSSSGESFVNATRPRFVVYSAGDRNRWGFPAAVVRRRWSSAGACELDTASSGAVSFVTDSAGVLQLSVRQRADRASLWTLDVPRLPPCLSGRPAVNSGGANGL